MGGPAKKVENMQMRSSGAGSAAAKKQAQRTKEMLPVVQRLQQMARGWKARSALAQLILFEELVLQRPTPGDEAMELLLPTPRPSAEQEGVVAPLGAAGASGRRGSQRGSSKTDAQGFAAPVPVDSTLDEQALAYRLALARAPEPRKAAAWILWLLDRAALDVSDLQRIAVHQRIRHKNAFARIKLRLTLVQHGDSCRTSGTQDAAARPLLPEGWAQVTRTAWALRLCPQWRAEFVLTSGVLCCRQTAERLGAVAADEGPESETPAAAGQAPKGPFPSPRACGEFDLPAPGSGALPSSPGLQSLARDVAAAVQEAESEELDPLRPPPPALFVAGGAALESLLACLNSGLPTASRAAATTSFRLGGGDAVLLESPGIFRNVGEGEDEVVRSPSELWEEALRRNQWRVVRHLRGDGRTLSAEPRKCEPLALEDELIVFDEDLRGPSETRNLWYSFAGGPLVMHEEDLSRIWKRAGSEHRPPNRDLTNSLRPMLRQPAAPQGCVAEDE